jgi:hypothetical protein
MSHSLSTWTAKSLTALELLRNAVILAHRAQLSTGNNQLAELTWKLVTLGATNEPEPLFPSTEISVSIILAWD